MAALIDSSKRPSSSRYMTICCIYIAQTTTTATSFTWNQSIDGKTVTCNAVNNSNPAYTDCIELRIDGYYFPNDVGCLSQWSTAIASQWDPLEFCRQVTGLSITNASIFYECDANQRRIVWIAKTWSFVEDMRYSRHLRCYF
ncbi:unnamed protein product [Adineta ricciae]|uniref:Uncharacterized protein n=1 Tax=Adineta ricciae TaxID=249248 RepID=A0A814BVX3_ADIRI|nr:unnamed protein product [Adineta ricciae]